MASAAVTDEVCGSTFCVAAVLKLTNCIAITWLYALVLNSVVKLELNFSSGRDLGKAVVVIDQVTTAVLLGRNLPG